MHSSYTSANLAGSKISGSLPIRYAKCFFLPLLRSFERVAGFRARGRGERTRKQNRLEIFEAGLFIPNPRIDVRISDIHSKVCKHQNNRTERCEAENQKVVAIIGCVDEVRAQPRNREHPFDHNGACDEMRWSSSSTTHPTQLYYCIFAIPEGCDE